MTEVEHTGFNARKNWGGKVKGWMDQDERHRGNKSMDSMFGN